MNIDLKNNMEVPATQIHILIVDDDMLTRTTITKVLAKVAYQVDSVDSGEAAIQFVQNRLPDLILLDVMMPGLDGFETCQLLREFTDYQTLPIIMMTGLDDDNAIDQAFNAGATDFITKPLNWSLLIQRLRYSLRTRQMAITLKANQERLAEAQRIAKLGYWHMEIKNKRLSFSAQTAKMLALKEEENLSSFLLQVHSEDRVMVARSITQAIKKQQDFTIEYRFNIPDNKECIVQQQAEMLCNHQGDVYRIVGTIQDITERKKADALIEYRTFYDDLTDLPNRRLLRIRLRHAINEVLQQGEILAMFLIGLDRFKTINETLGHTIGDQLLQEVAKRLQVYEADGASIARFGADIFALAIKMDSQYNLVFAQQLHKKLSYPHQLNHNEVYVPISIGIASIPMTNSSINGLLQSAETAMYKAKEKGGNQFQFFSDDMRSQGHTRLTLTNDLRQALERNELIVYYQPQISCKTGKPIGAEALLRWKHPTLGMVSPVEFIPIAEETGLIIDIGAWVLESACKEICILEAMNIPLRIGVNLSSRQFSQPGLLDTIKTMLNKYNINPIYLDLEITESIALFDFKNTIRQLQQIRELGIKTSIDDFGTGYSSLSYLHQLPIHTVKIDRAFVKDISTGNDDKYGAIAKAIIAMSHSLGLTVIAEGVECEAQQTYLCQQYCDELQGMLFGMPMPHETFIQSITQQMQSSS